MFSTEDWWSAWLGLFFFALGLLSIWQLDAVGWIAKPKTWEFSNLMNDFSEYQNLDPDNRTDFKIKNSSCSKEMKSFLRIVRDYREGI